MSDSPKITVLLATGLYPPEIGGPATYTQMLEATLKEHNVEVITMPFGSVRHLPKLVRHIAFAWKLWKNIRGVDVVYALDSISVGVPAWFVALIARKPFLIRLGGDYAWEQGAARFGVTQTLDDYTASKKGVPVPVRVLALIQGFVVRRAVRVVAPSAYLKSIIATWGVDQKKITVIYSSLHPLHVDASKDELRSQLAYEGTVIVSVGRLVPWKGFSELITAIASLKKEISDVSLVIIGDGPLGEDLRNQVERDGLQDTVRLVGRMGKETLGAAIKAADIFVLNTAYEGLSHQLLEVMDIGTPIITTNVGGNVELIKDGVSGFLVEPNDTEALKDTIKRLVSNKELQTRLTQNARVRVKDFAEETVVRNLVSLLQEIVLQKRI